MAINFDPVLANKIDPPKLANCSFFGSTDNFLLQA
uniref:Uncharacterized protein n=1 Tax=mine drainage metagenome TaxID=410659 RepID=E6QNT0_9ZZZZ